jgi:predicted ATPase
MAVSRLKVFTNCPNSVQAEAQAASMVVEHHLSLRRLWQQQDQRDQARQLLTEVYGWFTEGFETPDLQEARRWLDAG